VGQSVGLSTLFLFIIGIWKDFFKYLFPGDAEKMEKE